MSEITQTMKLRIHVNNEQEALFLALTQKYAESLYLYLAICFRSWVYYEFYAPSGGFISNNPL